MEGTTVTSSVKAHFPGLHKVGNLGFTFGVETLDFWDFNIFLFWKVKR